MAGRRRSWESLSPAYQKRLSQAGVSKGKYERGDSLSAARGHGQTPEHPREAYKRPEKYRDYIRKRPVSTGTRATPEDLAYDLNMAYDNAWRNVSGRLGNYIKFNRKNVIANIYGGIRGPQHHDEGPDVEVSGMSLQAALWTANADTEELRSRAESQAGPNPWWYH